MQYKLGRLAPKPMHSPDFTHYLKSPLEEPPLSVTAPNLTYPMADNDKIGDCTIASVIHCDQVWSSEVKEAYEYPGDEEVRAEYFTLSGGQDSGLVEQNVLQKWKNQGLFGNKIWGYAPVAPKHTHAIKQVVANYGAVYTGILMPQPAQEQFATGQPWTLTGTQADYNVLGGHAVPIVGYGIDGPTIVTWGKLQKVTWQWWMTYSEEAWVILPHEFIEAGRGPTLDLKALEDELTRIGG